MPLFQRISPDPESFSVHPVDVGRLRLADALVRDAAVKIIEDRRQSGGYILAKCPHDDGVLDHACFISNPNGELAGQIHCFSEACRNMSTEDFLLRYFTASRLSARIASAHEWVARLLEKPGLITRMGARSRTN